MVSCSRLLEVPSFGGSDGVGSDLKYGHSVVLGLSFSTVPSVLFTFVCRPYLVPYLVPLTPEELDPCSSLVIYEMDGREDPVVSTCCPVPDSQHSSRSFLE